MFKTKKIVLALGFLAQTGFASGALAQSNYNIATTPLEPQQSENQCLGQSTLDAHRYIDLRDLADYKTRLPGTSKFLMSKLESNAQMFLSELTPPGSGTIGEKATNAVFSRKGPQGPIGETVKSVKTDSNGKTVSKKVFQINNSREETRKNAILGVEIEKITEDACDSAFTMQLIMFVHDYNTGYFFRRVSVMVDFNKKPSEFRVLKHIEDIALNDTNFKVYGDLLSRKVIVKDEALNITKIMPIGVGAVDISPEPVQDKETGQWEYTVDLMTEEFPGGSLVKNNTEFGHYANTRSRVYPAYYSGRPFISIFNKHGVYRAIGMHYKISPDPAHHTAETHHLIRGFISHGCIRVRDLDLYQLDAIVNEGPHEKIEAHFLKSLPEFDHLIHPVPQENDYFNIVTYKDKRESISPEKGTIECPEIRSTYSVRKTPDFHTLADSDCLTKIVTRNAPTAGFISYARGLSDVIPQPELAPLQLAHYPEQAEHERLLGQGWNPREMTAEAYKNYLRNGWMPGGNNPPANDPIYTPARSREDILKDDLEYYKNSYHRNCSHLNQDCVSGRAKSYAPQCRRISDEEIVLCQELSRGYHRVLNELNSLRGR